jgi:glycogen operon protein
LSRSRFVTGQPKTGHDLPDITWHGTELNAAPWNDPDARHIAFTLAGIKPDEPALHIVLNMAEQAQTFALPLFPGKQWLLTVDTSVAPGVYEPGMQPAIDAARLKVEGRCVVVLELH